MEYISTRNKSQNFTFKEVFLNGLAADGGLYVPRKIPFYSKKDLNFLKELSYKKLATKIIYDYCSDQFSEPEIKDLVNKSYKKFAVKNVVNIKRIGNIHLLELFHGPTLAFKDIAMQIIGNMYEKILSKKNKTTNIIVATSGDTGAAAISALKGRKNLNLFVLHPHNKISKVQRKLMTTVKEKNIFNLAIKGNFDDCQKLVKTMFSDNLFRKEINMSGVNSINWARIVAQIVYYFFAYFKVNKLKKKINFSVPTGNFGDVFAGYIAKKMGLPINKLIVATNKNDILKRAINTGIYKPKKVEQTISPSMDIQVASNFERLIFFTKSSDAAATAKIMKKFKENHKFKLDSKQVKVIKKDFLSENLSEKETKKIIKKINDRYNTLVDPHTAIGIGVLEKVLKNGTNIVLSTAHPCKFPKAVKLSSGKLPKFPSVVKKIMKKRENFNILPNDIYKLKKLIRQKI